MLDITRIRVKDSSAVYTINNTQVTRIKVGIPGPAGTGGGAGTWLGIQGNPSDNTDLVTFLDGNYAGIDDPRLTDSRNPVGSAGGSLSGSYPNPLLSTTGVSSGTYTNPSSITVNTEGRISAIVSGSAGSTYTNEDAVDAVAAALVDSSSINVSYNDAGNTISLDAIFGTTAGTVCQGNDARLSDARTPTAHTHTSANITDFAEAVDDRVGALLVAGTNITLSYNDVGNTLTINSTASGGNALTVQDEGTSLTTAATSLNFIGAGVTATNTSGAVTVNIPGGGTSYTDEQVRDVVGATLVAGSNISITPNDAADTITIAATGIPTQYTDEQAQDSIGTILVDSATIDFTYSDATPSITASVIQSGIVLSNLSGNITDTQHGSRGGSNLHAEASTSNAGFMSASDKAKLDSIFSDSSALILNSLADVSVLNPQNNDVLTYNGAEWVNIPGLTGSNYVDLTSNQTIAGNKTFTGTTTGNRFIVGTDLSLIPINDNQSVISSWWGLQIVGNRQATVNYTPAAIGAANDFSVIIPNQQASKIGLVVQGASGQTGSLQVWRNSALTNVGSIDNSGNLSLAARINSLHGEVSGVVARSTNINVTNTTTETTIISYTLPANVLGTDRRCVVSIIGDYLNNTGAAASLGEVRVKIGGTTVYAASPQTEASGTVRRLQPIDIVIANRGSTNSQIITVAVARSSVETASVTTGTFQSGDANTLSSGQQAATSATIDMTVSRLVEVTLVPPVASANHSYLVHNAIMKVE